jgi:poly-gamma-glutamate synthesis protein (capsule biosynthesis protein)
MTALSRRRLLRLAAGVAVASRAEVAMPGEPLANAEHSAERSVVLALCGDAMLGRGIDQIQAHPGDPELHEEMMRSALDYVRLAETAHGEIPRDVPADYIWGDALSALRSADLRIVNLETSITTSRRFDPKGINYKMSPRNVGSLVAARIDCCLLANNHVLDWGAGGLIETLHTLQEAGIASVGAGRDLAEAERPLALELPGGGRLVVVACCHGSAGIPESWEAGPDRPGVHLVRDFSPQTVERLRTLGGRERRPGDIALLSIHWGPNWGYAIPRDFRQFARALIDEAGFDLVFGHSAHHAKGIEIRRDRLILHGAGDFIDDYEGIGGYETFRSDLVALYRARLSCPSGRLAGLEILPFRIRRFRLNRPDTDDLAWLADTLDRESRAFGVGVTRTTTDRLAVHW